MDATITKITYNLSICPVSFWLFNYFTLYL
jgi:hypothetical protein